MTTKFDILAAKEAHLAHISKHHCRLGDGCKERIALLRAYTASPQSAAARWHLDYDDDDRLQKQFRAIHPDAIP